MEMINKYNVINNEEDLCVIHPLFDKPEEKLNPDNVGPMKLSKSVKISLMALRIYLIAMLVLVVYRTLTMAGVLH